MKNVEINKNRAGMILGAFLGTFHLVWAILVAVGFAQYILDFIYKIHFLSNPFVIQEFNILTAVLLVAFTSLIGLVLGWFLAFLWNILRK
ncbi:MAG: hypothetical protein WC897_02450 [Candidatus Gracilibacteria bacterium]